MFSVIFRSFGSFSFQELESHKVKTLLGDFRDINPIIRSEACLFDLGQLKDLSLNRNCQLIARNENVQPFPDNLPMSTKPSWPERIVNRNHEGHILSDSFVRQEHFVQALLVISRSRCYAVLPLTEKSVLDISMLNKVYTSVEWIIIFVRKLFGLQSRVTVGPLEIMYQ